MTKKALLVGINDYRSQVIILNQSEDTTFEEDLISGV